MANTPEYTSLSDRENQWITEHIEYGRNFGLDSGDARTIADFFDSSLAAITSGEQPPEDANAVVNIVAVFLGEHVCSAADLNWAIVTDEFGTDLCVRSDDPSWVFFPQSSVAKRWEARETDWVLPFVDWVKQQVASAPK